MVTRNGQKPGLGFFRFPLSPHSRRMKWIKSIKRKDWKPARHTRVCGDHLYQVRILYTRSRLVIQLAGVHPPPPPPNPSSSKKGKRSDNPNDIDYIPTRFSFVERLSKSGVERSKRIRARKQKNEAQEKEQKTQAAEGILLLQESQFWVNQSTQTSVPECCNAQIQTWDSVLLEPHHGPGW